MKARALALLGFLFGILLLGAPARAATAPDTALVARARALKIAQSAEWQRLVHYHRDPWGGAESEVDGREFFLAPNGKSNPEAELAATLVAFLAPVVPGREDAHALCRFPARRMLLDGWLHFQDALPAGSSGLHCPAFERYDTALDPEAVTLVYSANFLNSPASAFGHTFLRLRKRRPPGSTQSSEKLDSGVEFTAEPDTANPILYAVKGIAGFFPGVFRFHSYEDKIREYGNSEARDLWEYDLALTPREVKLLELHLWELSATHIDYFYISENCTYHILGALEAAVPRLDLISHLKLAVLPKDTIKAISAVPGLVRKIHYRPSLQSQLRTQAARMGSREKDVTERLLADASTPLPDDLSAAERVRAIDAAVLVLEARLAKPMAPREQARVATDRALLSKRRGAFAIASPPPPAVSVPTDKAPEKGHASMRITFGSGATTQYSNGFFAFGYRLTLHDLTDPPDGEPELSQVQFFDTHVRYDFARRALTLDSLTFAELLALNPITRFEKSLSWRARGFGERLHDRGCPDGFAHGVEAAVGATVATDDEHLALFVMADAYVAFSGALDGIGGSFVRAGVGPLAGLRVRLPAHTIGLVTGRFSYLPGASLRGTYDVRANVRTTLAKDVALGVEAVVQPLSTEIQFSSYLYF